MLLEKLITSILQIQKNSTGCIYIVRDPRNVITSVMNHYELDEDMGV